MAYLVGLISSDGCLSKDGRHIDLTSKDYEQLCNFNKSLGRDIPISTKPNGRGSLAFRVQFSDTSLYDFLLEAGITPNKSLTMPALNIPDEFFVDFLRGNFDGDGTTYGFRDKRWKSSFMYYLCFISASKEFLIYIDEKIFTHYGVQHKNITQASGVFKLSYAKKDASLLAVRMYHSHDVIALSRKRNKLEGFINGGRGDILT